MTPLNMIQIAACTLNQMLLEVNVPPKRGLESFNVSPKRGLELFNVLLKRGLELGCFNAISTIFQLYHGCQVYWWRKPEYTTEREKKIIVMDSGSQLTYPIKIKIC